MRLISVQLGERSYSIHIGRGARQALGEWFAEHAAGCRAVVVADGVVAKLHLQLLSRCLPADPLVVTFPPGEASKSLGTLRTLYHRLARARVERSAVIVAFGGGVAGDLAGFLAATWLRGVRYIQVPTNLLAGIDASVGGKTGVNLRYGKNLVGAFYQPKAVIIDTDFLQTLPERDFSAGLAESVKHAAIHDPSFLTWHETHANEITGREEHSITDLIARNCEIKAEIVAQDELEAGFRAILNHGHTIGHAIEHVSDYALRHGECVALGMLVENELARSRGMLPLAQAGRVAQLLSTLGLPRKLPQQLSAQAILAACRVDKKISGGAVNFILLRSLGHPEWVSDITPAEILDALSIILPD